MRRGVGKGVFVDGADRARRGEKNERERGVGVGWVEIYRAKKGEACIHSGHNSLEMLLQFICIYFLK